MSGKYAKKKNNRGLLAVLVIVLVIAAAAVAVMQMSGEDGGMPSIGGATTAPSGAEQEMTEGVTEEPTEAPTELPVPDGIDLGNGLAVTEIGSYTGAYVEDGSDEEVSNVLMMVVYNYGVAPIQYAQFTMNAGGQTANFTMSTLPVGESMVLLETSRMAYDENAEYTQVESYNVAEFNTPMSLCQDKIQIQPLEGALNIINISGKDIDGDVVVYYKKVSDGQLLGGITYRVRLSDGMKADEIRQIMTEHFYASDSRVMFITCG